MYVGWSIFNPYFCSLEGGGWKQLPPPPPRILKEGKKKGTEQREEREKYEGQMRKEAKSKNC